MLFQSIRVHYEIMPTLTQLLPLHLNRGNALMYYTSSLFYHGFALINYVFSCHMHHIAITHDMFTYLASLHSCRDRDAGSRGLKLKAGT